jgi:hypothetical protein
MSDDDKSAGQPFLSRWSQRKLEARDEPPATPPVVDAEAAIPVLPPIESLTLESDFSGFLHPKVDADLRRAALKKLFRDPHFNVMDGLDTYIDDYSKPDPLPPGMLAGLRQAQNILAWAKETKEETAARFAPPPAVPAVPTEQELLTEGDAAPPQANDQTTDIASPADGPATVTEPAAAERKS